ncbi:unnamed protein product [Aphanomyces euteiches]
MTTKLLVLMLFFSSFLAHGDSTCRYAKSPGNVLTAGDGLCSPNTSACIVDSTCAEVWHTPASDVVKFTNVNRLGDMSQYALTALEIQNCSVPFTFDASFKLPDQLNTFALENCLLMDDNLPNNVAWPEMLHELHLGKNQLDKIPSGLPSSLISLWLNDNQLTDLPRQPTVTKTLHAASNKITQLSAEYSSMSQAVKIHLAGNPIARISKVDFSSSLVLLYVVSIVGWNLMPFASDCAGCAITTFELSRSSLEILDKLGPYNAASDTGFLVATVAFNATSCSDLNGEMKLLQNLYPVCVLDPIQTAPPPTTYDAPNSTWMYIGIAVAILLLLLCCSLCYL